MAKAIDTLSIKLDFKAGSGSQQIIDKIGNSIKNLKVIAGQTGPSVEKVRRSINDFAKQGNRSISTIEGQVTALRALRREADINSKEFKELTADIAKYERQLNKAQGRSGGGGARQATQVAGAVISGGIFGGPEGALGGLAGAGLGGVQGAFAGAAIGAQAAGIRKAIGAAADYSAQIQKLEIGLRGVVSSESEFNQAIAAANSATKDFNISAIDSITGITRLSAAVIGAGGNLTDVEIVFRGISSAVIATGGSADDVRSAITAMVQVFSKGKVSAEELSGQLGERLPGAVVRFAKAAFGTGPEAMQKLQKELKAGTVGLNELMIFASDTGLEFEDLAKKIAGSSASAGARLNILVDAFRLELGTAIQPIGAQIQDFAGEVLVEFKDEIISVVKELGKLVLGLLALAKFVGDNKEVVGFFADLALKIGLAHLAIKGLAGIQTSFAGVVAAGTKAKITGDVAQTSAGKVTLLKNALTGLAALGVVTVGINFITKGFGDLAEFNQKVDAINQGIKDPAAQFKGMTKKQVEESQAEMRKEAVGLRAQIAEDQKPDNSTATGLRRLIPQALLQLAGQKTDLDVTREKLLRPGRLKQLEAALNVDPSDFAVKAKKTVFDPLNPDGTGGTGPKDISEAMADKLIGANNLRQKGVQITKEDILAQQKIALEAAKSLLPQRQRVEVNKINVKTANDIFALEERNRKEAEQKLIKEREKAVALSEIKLITGEITQEEFDQQEIRQQAFELTKLFPEQLERVQAALEEAASPLGQFKKGLKELFESAMDLKTALGEFAVQAVDSFGDAFADFVTTGKANFADFTASILRDLAKIFARAALFKTLSMIPGVGNFLGLTAANGAVTKSMTPPTTIPGGVGAMAANGLAVAKNGIVPYAKGGLVTKPTLFQYKQGGVGSYGLMGEAGTEAIMPLRRGANGKLGVEASGSGVGDVVVNVDAAGSSVEGDGNQAAQLGKAIGIAVQQELVKQKRPGGLLSR